MPINDPNFLTRLLATFKVEARDHIEAIASGLIQLENASTEVAQATVLDKTFRSAHSLKGAARTVSATEIEALCQSLESVFAELKTRQVPATPELFDLLHQVVDALGKLLQSLDAAPDAAKPDAATLVRFMQAVLAGESPRKLEPTVGVSTVALAELNPTQVGDVGGPETVRVAITKLDAVLRQGEELLSAKLAAAQRATKLRQLHKNPCSQWNQRWGRLASDFRVLRKSIETKQDQNGAVAPRSELLRVLDFLEWNHNFVESLATELVELANAAERDERSLAAMVDNLLDEMKRVVMQPFSTLLDIFPRFVRELSRDQGKEVALVVQGSDIEIDRRILDEMKDPLIQLVRNCIDHGIEKPSVRAQAGKSATGAITINISAKDGSNVEILVSDDGIGIDASQVRAAAVNSGVLPKDRAEALSEREVLPLIFRSGVSTSAIITDISGRGIGLAIVNDKVGRLNGALSVETNPGHGTTFRIVLPVTLARFRAVIVRVDEHQFVIPTSSVERITRPKREDISTVENRKTLSLNGEAVALAVMAEVLQLPANRPPNLESEVLPAVILSSAGQRVAFVVDEVLSEQEVLMKTLGRQLVRVRNIAGATVLGSGRVVPILNAQDLMQSAIEATHSPRTDPPPSGEIVEAKKSILIAEDSISSRSLLKNILQSAGYDVTAAVDGVDAFSKLRSSTFDLVVSDVEMPRMDGFALAAKIRADKKYAELPVILVTALESREDRERGIDAGADAYILKSNFDHNNLLEVIRRLL